MRYCRSGSPRTGAAFMPSALPRGLANALLASQLALALNCSLGLAPAAAQDASTVVYDADGLRATTYTSCDDGAYTLVALTETGSAERYASSEKFAAKLEPHATDILNAAADWLDGEGATTCATPPRAETNTLVGLVNALPVYAAVASRRSGWRTTDIVANARVIPKLARALPPTESVDCRTFDDAAGSKIDKYRTRVFTIRVAHTTGQWSHMQALTKLVPLHQEIMGLVGQWGFEWQCEGDFDLAGLAILADEERAVLLKWNGEKIRERVADASPEELAAVMTEVYRTPALPPVSSFDQIPFENALRYGGYLSPDVAATEALFAEAGN